MQDGSDLYKTGNVQADAGANAWEHHTAAAARSEGGQAMTPEASEWDQVRRLDPPSQHPVLCLVSVQVHQPVLPGRRM